MMLVVLGSLLTDAVLVVIASLLLGVKVLVQYKWNAKQLKIQKRDMAFASILNV